MSTLSKSSEAQDSLPGHLAPDFALNDTAGRLVRLSDFRGQRHVVLVFNRGVA